MCALGTGRIVNRLEVRRGPPNGIRAARHAATIRVEGSRNGRPSRSVSTKCLEARHPRRMVSLTAESRQRLAMHVTDVVAFEPMLAKVFRA